MKKISILVCCLLVLFIIFNAAWMIDHEILFGKYEYITKDDNIPDAFVSPRNELTFSVSKKKYLNFGGNLGISSPQEEKYLIIWPHICKDTSFGYMISDGNQSYNFLVNSEGYLLNKESLGKNEQATFEENKDYLLYLLSEYRLWSKAAENGEKAFFESDFER